MKIWKAELILNYTIKDKWESNFYFELQDENYEINEKFNEWTYFKDWVGYEIPMDMKIEPCCYGGKKVVQGFDRKLSDDELKNLENEMRKFMVKYLNDERGYMLNQFKEKISAVIG